MFTLYYLLFLTGLTSGFLNDHAFDLLFNITASYTALIFVFYGLALTVALAEEPYYPIFPLFLGYGGLMYFRNLFDPVCWVLTYPVELTAGVAVYLLVGLLWSIPRLKLYVRSREGQAFLKRQVPSKPTATRSGSVNRICLSEDVDRASIVSEFLTNHKMLIYSWILYWPLSMVFTLTHDFMRELLDYMFGRMKRIYTSIILTELDKHLGTLKRVASTLNKDE